MAGRLHTARSRNDIDMTMYRMRQREFILGVFSACLDLRRSLLDVADRHRETVFAVHTHTQRAQPTTVAHYLLAVVEQLERDARPSHRRLCADESQSARRVCDHRHGIPYRPAAHVGAAWIFGPTGNTYGSIATVDYLLESASATSVLLVGLGRFVQDLLLWCTAEFDYVRLGDGFVQASSIMPQKRNPVALEHARAIGSKALGQTHAIVTAVHNTPFGDIVDTEDDLQPLVFSMFRDATRTVKLVAAAMTTAEFDPIRLEARAADGWTTLTELADTLVRDRGVPFKAAHQIAGGLMAARQAGDTRPLPEILASVSASSLGAPLVFSDAELREILSPRHFVDVRRTLGGPAPVETARAAAASRSQLAADQEWWARAKVALEEAERALAARAATL